MLFRDVAPGESLRIGDITIRVEKKTGASVRLAIDAPHEVEHIRAERPTLTQAPSSAPPSPPPAPAPAGQVVPLLRRPAAA
jgi:sRNA-binding carbon storage regulator CsrA